MAGWALRIVTMCGAVLISFSFAGAQTREAVGVGDYSDKGIRMWSAGAGFVGKTPITRFESDRVDEPLTGAIVRIRAAEPATNAWFRFRTDETTTDWILAKPLGDLDSPVRLFATHSDNVYTAAFLEVAVAGSGVELLDAAIFDNRQDDDARAVTWNLAHSERGQLFGKIIPPHLIKRSEWGADPFRGDPIPLARPSYDIITIHHAACCGAYSYEDGIRQVKGIQEFHQDGRGWSDIGYHFVLDQSGRLYQGRPFMNEGVDLDDTPILAQGAHVGGYNTGNIGVSLLGCYHPPEGSNCQDVISPAALDSLVAAVAFLSERYGVPPSQIRGHRDFSSTACPGDNNYRLLPQIKEMVAELLKTGNAPVGAGSLLAGVDGDGVVHLSWQFSRDNGIVRYRVERESGGEISVVYAGDSAEDVTWFDPTVRMTGPVTYSLLARNADGRWATLAVSEVELVQPTGFELAQSFPNPSETSSTIRYFLNEEGFVLLELFDAAGRRVETLVNRFQAKGRWYAVRVSTADLAPGQYYYRLRVDGFAGIAFDSSKGLAVSR